ncbi:hypothetical protein [Roseomonas indoligenes]|uniref:Uncharacterized protein n=1 Tax=Roseomonas indoligenes TaxID=2820811 RepID=A0A940N633_9PROT|nr:hypothetical protein [Pararoseomonas indoligenes]MBP0495785.1 hypothetical protein [Pararoseomonas indoligenes]
MTIIVSVKINDGVVMAADSAGTMASGQVYGHANKITNLYEGLPIGAMSTGAGGIGNESVETLLKDLRRRFAGLDPEHADWRLDPAAYTLEDVAHRLRTFLFEERVQAGDEDTSLQLRVCGYSAGRPLAEVWEVNIVGRACPAPRCIMGEEGFGVLWDGQYEALNRLILGTGFEIGAALARHGIPKGQASHCRQGWSGTSTPHSRPRPCRSRTRSTSRASSSRPPSDSCASRSSCRNPWAGRCRSPRSPSTRASAGCSDQTFVGWSLVDPRYC